MTFREWWESQNLFWTSDKDIAEQAFAAGKISAIGSTEKFDDEIHESDITYED